MDIKGIGLKPCEPVEDIDSPFPEQVQIGKRLSYPQVGSVITAHLHAQEGAKLFVLFDERMFKICTPSMMSLVKTFKYRLEFPIESFGDLGAEHVRYLSC